MTNTLHRFGTAESFDDDFIVFAMACKGPFKQADPLTDCGGFYRSRWSTSRSTLATPGTAAPFGPRAG